MRAFIAIDIPFEKEFKQEELVIKDAFDQITLTAIAFANDKKNHWSCYLKYYEPKLYKKYFP